MTRIFSVLCFLLLFAAASFLSAQETVSRIEKLDLGRVRMDVSASLALQTDGAWGKVGGRRIYPWLSVQQNPAFGTGFRRPVLMIRWTPGAAVNLGRWLDLNRAVRSTVDGIVADYAAQNVTPHYPNLDLLVGPRGSWPEGMLLFPVDRLVVGFSFFRSVLVRGDFDVTGVRTSISTRVSVGGGSNLVLLNNYLDATARVVYRSSLAGFFLALPVGRKGALGVYIERRAVNTALVSDWNIQGAMIYNGREYLFNDPDALWPNRITQHLEAAYSGASWQATWGGWWLLPRGWILDISLQAAREAVLAGETRRNQHKIPALNPKAVLSGGGVEEILDPVKLDLSRLTYTEPVEAAPVPQLRLSFPVQVKLGASKTLGSWAFYFSDRIRLGSFRFRYGPDRDELRLRHELSLYAAKGHFYAHLGFAPVRVDVSPNQDFLTGVHRGPLPVFSLGYGRTLGIGLSVIGGMHLLPLPGLAVALQYRFLTGGLP